jgi:hypothetical protein
MNRRRAVIALGLAGAVLAVVLAGVSLATPTADSSKARSLKLVFRFSDANTRLDHGNQGLTTGDTDTYSGPLLGGSGKRIGFGQGTCAVTLPGRPLAECIVTLALPTDQIALLGPNYFNRPFNQAIVGGTGEYRSARGEMRAAPIDGGAGWRLRLTLVD